MGMSWSQNDYKPPSSAKNKEMKTFQQADLKKKK